MLSSRRSSSSSRVSPVTPFERSAIVEVAAELRLEQAVDALQLLLLAQLERVLGELRPRPGRAGRADSCAARWRTCRCSSAPLQEELQTFPPAEPADGLAGTEPRRPPSARSDAPPLRRPASVVRDRRHVLDQGDREARPPAGDRSADSRPAPGPFTNTWTCRMPMSDRLLAPRPRRPPARRTACPCGSP